MVREHQESESAFVAESTSESTTDSETTPPTDTEEKPTTSESMPAEGGKEDGEEASVAADGEVWKEEVAEGAPEKAGAGARPNWTPKTYSVTVDNLEKVNKTNCFSLPSGFVHVEGL